MSKELIRQYYNQLHSLKRAGVSNEMAIKQPFDMLVLQMAGTRHYVYATEVTIKNENGKNIRPDGILMNELRIHKGYVESKDTDDSIDDEIQKKIHKDKYPSTNIIFQDSETAVLIQHDKEVMRVEMKEMDDLESILRMFIDFKPAYIDRFEDALDKFKEDIPTIVETLRELIERQNEENPAYQKGRDEFWEMCKQEVNPEITEDDIREMVIQHILTEDLFKSVFDETDFHHENNIARELEGLVNTFMNREIRQNQLSELGHYYRTLNTHASQVADHHEKQRFLKVVYENFYKVYNPKGADRLGVVYTPNEIVDFMIRSTDYLLEKHFNRSLHHENVHILDPATGTGTFITDIIEYIPNQYLEYKYTNEIHANEVAILPYYVANLNIEFTYKQKTGQYKEFPNICFVDTLDNTSALQWDRMSIDQGVQSSMFAVSSENAERIKRQNQQKISVVIGNPPYNANQANFNDFNKNREYPDIDKRIKNTYVKHSTAQKTKVYDMYSRFYRWAMDRIDENGVIAFITNRSFINSRTFDGFRKCVEDDFDYCYIIDTKSDVRANPKIAGTTHNVFGIQTGVAIMFLIRKEERTKGKCQIYYNGEIEDDWLKEKKLVWISDTDLKDIRFERIEPSKKHNWIDLVDNDFENLLPTIDEDSEETIFKRYAMGVVTARDEWVYDLNIDHLKKRMKFFIDHYSKQVGRRKKDFDSTIKWSSTLKRSNENNVLIEFDESKIQTSFYRPFNYRHFYAEKVINDRLTGNHKDFFGSEYAERTLCFGLIGKDTTVPFSVLAFNAVNDLNSLSNAAGGNKTFPLNFYNSNNKKVNNITDWGLEQFQTHYEDATISKEDIFHYTYGVLHDPAYRKKYELNLKREFPRIPFYEDFHQWKEWGKELMELHIDYEDAEPFKLILKESQISSKPKAKLKADKAAGTIQLDENTQLSGVPAIAWEYKLGNRSALEWILDQYKEKKPRDKTIREKFNTYQFADYKTEVIELLQKVTTVSVKTMEIVKEMEKVDVGEE
ncbi:MAG: type ISP restriction/modification enzyme [Balneolaceae bacterium]